MSVLKDLFASKKFITALAAAAAAAAGFLGFDLSPEQVALIITPLASYIVGQGIADHGKEAAQIAADATSKGVQDAAPPALGPDARLAALEQWVRANAGRLGAGSVPGDPAAGPAAGAKP